MGKLMYGIMFMVILEIALILYAGPQYSHTEVLTLIAGLYDFNNNAWIAYLMSALTVTTVVVILGLYVTRNEWIVYAGMTLTFMSFGVVITGLWQFIAAQDFFGDSSNLIASLICLPILIGFVFLCLDFSRGKD